MAKLRAADAEKRAERDMGPDFSEALARGLTIITAFDPDHRQMTLSDVARVVDLPRATARRALFTLVKLGYVETDGRLFRLTPRILKLAAAYLSSDATTTILQPACERIAREVDESCTAAVLDGDEVVMVARALPAQIVPVGVGVGYRLPAFCSALGRVLLSALPDDRLEDWLQRLQPVAVTPSTVIDKRQLRDAILRVREDGYAFVDQEAEFGFRSIAVPIRRYDGVVVAALNIGARVERATPETMQAIFRQRLTLAADELKVQLI